MVPSANGCPRPPLRKRSAAVPRRPSRTAPGAGTLRSASSVAVAEARQSAEDGEAVLIIAETGRLSTEQSEANSVSVGLKTIGRAAGPAHSIASGEARGVVP